MKRRDLLKSIVPVGASFLLGDVKHIPDSQAQPDQKPPEQDSDLTRYAAEFALKLKYEDIPAEIVSLGKKSILDGFGLALAGSIAQSGAISRKYGGSFGASQEASTLIGSSFKGSPRFAAFVNSVSNHADGLDDTQMCIAQDRAYSV